MAKNPDKQRTRTRGALELQVEIADNEIRPEWSLRAIPCPLEPELTLPADIRTIIDRFPEKCFRSLLTHVAGKHGKPWTDLLICGDHGLAFVLALLPAFRGTGPRPRIKDLLGRKRRDILQRLSFGNVSPRLLRRVPLSRVTMNNLLLLRANVGPDGALCRRLSHVPYLNKGVLDIVLRPGVRRFASQRLLIELGSDSERRIPLRLSQIVRRAQQLGRHPAQTDSIRQLVELNAELTEFQHAQKLKKLEFPPPPLPGICGRIEPCDTGRSLTDEGKEMNHCIANMAFAIAAGTGIYVYRVLPLPMGTARRKIQRATALLQRERGHWGLSEVQGTSNANVNEETVAFVQDWLRSVQPLESQEDRETQTYASPTGLDRFREVVFFLPLMSAVGSSACFASLVSAIFT